MTTPEPQQQSRGGTAAGGPKWAPPNAQPWPPNQQPPNPIMPPQGWPSAPSGPPATRGVTQPPTRLGLSIVALVCSLPLLVIPGAIGLYFSTQVTSRWSTGDVAGAQKASRTALIIDIVAIVLGVLILIGTTSSSGSSY
jgi:hypothetical protein